MIFAKKIEQNQQSSAPEYRSEGETEWELALRHHRRALLFNPHNAISWMRYGTALQQAGYSVDALSCYLRTLALDPLCSDAASALVTLGWSEAHLAALRPMLVPPDENAVHNVTPACKLNSREFKTSDKTNCYHKRRDELDSPPWITPDNIKFSFLRGVIARCFLFGAPGNEMRQPQWMIPIPQERDEAVIIPFVALSDRLLQIECPLALNGALPKLHFELYRILGGRPLSAGVAQTSGDSAVVLKVNTLIEQGTRYFVALWCKPDGGAAVPVLSAAPFSSDHYWDRQLTAVSFPVNVALPDPALLRPSPEYRIGLLGHTEDARFRVYCRAIRQFYPDANIRHRTLTPSAADLLEWASDLHFCFFIDVTDTDAAVAAAPDLGGLMNSHGIATAYLRTNFTASETRSPSAAVCAINDTCHYAVEARWAKSPPVENDPGPAEDPIFDLVWRSNLPDSGAASEWVGYPSIRSLRAAVWPLEGLPHVAIITVLFRKRGDLENFFRAVYRQTYPGEISIVFVDDASPDNDLAAARLMAERCDISRPARISLTFIKNEVNLGNCASRNRGVAATDADIYVIIDCDCLINSDFVTAHVREHLTAPTDAVIGPLNLETGGQPGWEMLLSLEDNNDTVLSSMNMQDDIQLDGFVNCITRNLSISRGMLSRCGGFDVDFSYSMNPESGFGWEDVEFGYRLYRAGAYIRFTPDAFSLHQSHPASIPEQRKWLGSARNFNRLFDKHPEMTEVVRRWATDTAQKILQGAERAQVQHPEIERVRNRCRKSQEEIGPFLATWRTGQVPLRIVSYRWHVPHQYEIHKLPHHFTLITGTGTAFTNEWAYSQRPLRSNVRMLPVERFDPREYDLAILHFDENVLCSDLSNGVIGKDWGKSFCWALENVEVPIIAVCHGTVPFVGQYAAQAGPIGEFREIEEERRRLVRALGETVVICNSYQAAREWGFARARVIWHGMDPQEFPPGTHQRDVVSHGVDRYRPHYRGAHLLEEITRGLSPDIAVASHTHPGPKLVSPNDPRYGERSYRCWVDHLRSFKVYLNTTLRSPMPRSRTEAMMCGVIPVSIRNHDVDHFITPGVNGFYGESAEELADAVRFVCGDDAKRSAIAQRARQTATRVFNHDRFLTQWTLALKDIGI